MASREAGTSTKRYVVPETSLFVTCYVGDIGNATTEGVVTGEVNNQRSRVTDVLIERLGSSFEVERRFLIEENRYKHTDEVLVIKTERTKEIKFVFFVPVTLFTMSSNPEKWIKDMSSEYLSVFKMADSGDVKSLTFPILGSGAAGAPLGLAIRALVNSLFNCKTKTLNDVRIVSTHRDVHDEVVELCDDYFQQGHDRTEKSRRVRPRQERNNNFDDIPDSLEPILQEQFYQTTYNDHFSDPQQMSTSKSNSNSRKRQSSHNDSNEKGTHIRRPQMNITGNQITKATRATSSNTTRAPTNLSKDENSNTLPIFQTSKHSSTQQCPICLDNKTKMCRLSKCNHEFCEQCISDCFKHKPICPVCNTVYGVITGNQPDGRMEVEMSRKHLPGYPDCGTIVITYSFYDGVQKSEHPNPGEDYRGTVRTAYFPDNAEGRKVCRLLRTAFDRKLTFTIGLSSTTGKENVVTWNDIHHKTNIHGGPQKFGYPDSTYLTRVQEELASKGVT